MFLNVFFIKVCSAKVSVTGPSSGVDVASGLSFDVLKTILGVGSVFMFLFGLILLLNSLVLFLIAAGEEPKMAKAFSEFKFGLLFFLVSAVAWGGRMMF